MARRTSASFGGLAFPGGNRKGRGVGTASAEAGHEDVKAVTSQGATLASAQKRAPTALWAAGASRFSPAPPTGVGGVSGGVRSH